MSRSTVALATFLVLVPSLAPAAPVTLHQLNKQFLAKIGSSITSRMGGAVVVPVKQANTRPFATAFELLLPTVTASSQLWRTNFSAQERNLIRASERRALEDAHANYLNSHSFVTLASLRNHVLDNVARNGKSVFSDNTGHTQTSTFSGRPPGWLLIQRANASP